MIIPSYCFPASHCIVVVVVTKTFVRHAIRLSYQNQRTDWMGWDRIG